MEKSNNVKPKPRIRNYKRTFPKDKLVQNTTQPANKEIKEVKIRNHKRSFPKHKPGGVVKENDPNLHRSSSCLIIGDGPSKSMINLKKKYLVDTIIGVHKADHQYTEMVCTVDVSCFAKKERIAIENGKHLILGGKDRERAYKNIPKEYHHRIEYMDCKAYFNSGLFAIEYASRKGYKHIFTAGLDMWSDTTKPYVRPEIIKMCNKLLKDPIFRKANIYKCSPESKLELEVRLPNVFISEEEKLETQKKELNLKKIVKEPKSCLIIGDGPSKMMIDMECDYAVKTIICIHKPDHSYVNMVCSADARKYFEKEQLAVKRKIPIVIGHNHHNFPSYIPEADRPYIKFHNYKTLETSGVFAIEWAIEKGYKKIYTAGIDLWSPTDHIHPYIRREVLEKAINKIKILSHKAKIYKVSKKSKIPALIGEPIKMPHNE